MANGNGSRAGWWAAGVLAALMVGGAGTFYSNLKSPSQSQVDRIEERQQLVLQRLASIEARLDFLDVSHADIDIQLRELQAAIEELRKSR